jgi:RNA polymerase sigma-70 factor (ECF subfamily)
MDIQDLSNEQIKKAAQGDVAAEEALYMAAHGFVYHVALGMIGNVDDAYEVSQETFIKIFENLDQFKFQSSLKTWIYRITVNTALNARKKQRSLNHRRVAFDESVESLPDNAVERHSVEAGMSESVHILLNSLSPDQRACVVLRDMEGLRYDEIAKVLHININTVRSRLKRARENLLRKGENYAV